MRPTPTGPGRLPRPGAPPASPGSSTGLRSPAGGVLPDDRTGPVPLVASPNRSEPAGSVSPNRLDSL
ncbi:hypothetical protein ACWEP8_11815 [Streptomyces hydrogenans]